MCRETNFLEVSLVNGGGGIRTHGALADTLVFKTRALNHSTTPPRVRLLRIADQL